MIANKATNRLRRFEHLIRGRWNLYRLSHTGSEVSSSFANALRATLKTEASSEEQDWVDRIEALRNELNSSVTEIEVLDFGAGTSGSARTQAEMSQGAESVTTVGSICRTTSKPPVSAFLLFKLIREFRPAVCVEMGTSVGISGAYQAAALRLNRKGHIVTLEGAESVARVAKDTFRGLGLDNVEVVVGKFQDTLYDVLVKHQPVDYVFVDGHHDERATIAYFEQIIPFLSGKAIIIFDDISWSDGMRRAWMTIVSDKSIDISVDLSSIGACIFDEDLHTKQSFWIAMT